MTDYLQKMKSVADNLAIAVQPITDDNFILHILGELGPDYDALVVSITSRHETITLADLHGLLLSHEIRLENLTIVEQCFSRANLTSKYPSTSSNPRGDGGYERNFNSTTSGANRFG